MKDITSAQRSALLAAQQGYLATPSYSPSPVTGATGSITGATAPLAAPYQEPVSVQNAILNAQLAAARAPQGSKAATDAVKQEIAAYQYAIKTITAQLHSLSAPNQTAARQDILGFLQSLQGLTGTTAPASGQGFFSGAAQGRMAAALQNVSGITGASAPTSTSIQALTGEIVQTQSELKKLDVAIKKHAYVGTELANALTEQTTLVKQENAAKQLRLSQQQNLTLEGVLGIAPTGLRSGAQAAASSSSSLRTFLNDTLKQFGLAQTGSSALGPYITELHKLGDINNRQYTSLEKILTAIGLMKKDTGTISSSISGNVTQRLAEIKSELAAATGFSDLYAAAGYRVAGLSAQQAQTQAGLTEHRGTIPYGGALGGIPLLPTGAPATSGHVTLIHTGDTTINVPGYHGDPKALADVLSRAQVNNSFRNVTQVRGVNAGVHTGFPVR